MACQNCRDARRAVKAAAKAVIRGDMQAARSQVEAAGDAIREKAESLRIRSRMRGSAP